MNEERFVIDFKVRNTVLHIRKKKREEEKGSCNLKNSF